MHCSHDWNDWQPSNQPWNGSADWWQPHGTKPWHTSGNQWENNNQWHNNDNSNNNDKQWHDAQHTDSTQQPSGGNRALRGYFNA
jgi:hypothetical protein